MAIGGTQFLTGWWPEAVPTSLPWGFLQHGSLLPHIQQAEKARECQSDGSHSLCDSIIEVTSPHCLLYSVMRSTYIGPLTPRQGHSIGYECQEVGHM